MWITGEETSITKNSVCSVQKMAFWDGGNKRRHDAWDEGWCVNMDGEWTGKTIFVLNSAVKERQQEHDEIHAFLAERSIADMSKSGKTKGIGKQFKYGTESEEAGNLIDGSRKDECEKWQKFMAVRQIEGEEIKQLSSEGHRPISTQWIDADKNLHFKRLRQPRTVKCKSGLLARGDQEKRLEIRTAIPA